MRRFFYSSASHNIFAPMSGVSAIAIASGEQHTCVIVAGGGVKCWGWNGYGQLGIGITGDRYSPADVPGLASTNSLSTNQKQKRQVLDK